MEALFEEMDVGDTDAIKGKNDGFKYNILGMKEPNYVMQMMVMGGALLTEGCKSVAHVWDNGTTKNSTTPSHMIGISRTAILWIITTISHMQSHP